jgi:hypothetical protein
MKKTSSTKNSEKSRNLEETHLTENHNPVLEFGIKRWVKFKTEEYRGNRTE